MNKNILLCGVGGQGTVLASKLIAQCYMKKDIPVMSAETIGMAQKGGSVFSHLRVGEGICTPMLRRHTADIIIGFEPAEAVRQLPYLKKGGTVIVNSASVMPVTGALSGSDYCGAQMIDYLKQMDAKLLVVDGEKAISALGSAKVLNMVLLGAASVSGALGLSIEDLKDAVVLFTKKEYTEMNFKALEYYRSL